MRVLVLGGTSFVGRAIVAALLRSGAEVTLFNRGRTGPDLFSGTAGAAGVAGVAGLAGVAGVARRVGDRDTGDYASLRTGEWDVVVDVSGYTPRHVGQAMDTLGDRVGRYLFISAVAVYERTAGPGANEDAPRRAPVRDTEELREDTYGPLKVACEDDVLARYGSRATIVRPGKVAGPHDPQDGLTYWVRRAARGGRVALPGRPEQPVQVVDSRDLAHLVVCLLTDDRPGAFQAVGPARPTTMAELIATCARAAGSRVEVVPVPPDAVSPFFPLVRPKPLWPTQQRSPARARAAGMPATPLAVTAADVLTWDRDRGQPPLHLDLSPAEERRLLTLA